jgi:hypothetical protein
LRTKALGVRTIRQDGRGLGDAIKTGVRETSGEIADHARCQSLVPTTAPTSRAPLLAKMQRGYDPVIASRMSEAPEHLGMFSPQRPLDRTARSRS